MNNIVSNCPLCEQHGLHVIDSESDNQQCISCGYVTSNKFVLNGQMKENSEAYKELTEDMQNWSTVKNDRIWIPTIMTLPIGMLYPFNNEDGELAWSFAKLIEIPEDERKDYPVEGQDGKFYEKKLDTDNSKVYDLFFDAMMEVNKLMKEQSQPKPTEIKLPKLKKTDEL